LIHNDCMKKYIRILLVFFSALALSLPSSALTCGVPGKDGVATISASVNTYFPPNSGNLPAGSTTINVGAGTGPTAIATGDLVLVIQMQDSSGSLEGNFEYAQVVSGVSLAGGAIRIASGLINSYAQSFGATTLQTYQVIRVPQYSSATISGTVSPPAWTINTGTGAGTGGIFAIDVAGTLALNGTIDASGRGFRGAFGINGTGNRAGGLFTDTNYTPNLADMNGSLKGEGTNGVPNQVFAGVVAPVVYTSGLYAVGTAGRAANGNAGGGGNDGAPATGGNQYNSGGGGGSNAGAGGRGGNSWSINNVAGGLGGNALANSATKLYMGGGGGAGSTNNNGNANSITTYPPTAVTNFGTVNTFSGASGPISSSGASGGGIVILRASNVTVGGGSVVSNGYTSYSVNGGSESTGGAGGGGSVLIQAASSSGAIPVTALGGKGGDSNYFDHGPGGGGGGGFVGISGVTTTNNFAGGVNGADAANGGDNIANDYNAQPGSGGASATLGPPGGTSAPNACLPNISVVKATSTPTISVSGATTATYTITATNTSAGFATGADFVDNTLPPGWTFASTGAITFAPPLSGTVLGGFVEGATPGTPAVAGGPGAVGNLAVNGAPAAAPLWGNVTIPGNGTATLTYTVNIPATAPAGVFHNPAGLKYIDPTRSTAGREIAANTNNTANRAGAQVGGTANNTYQTGSVAASNVLGSNYSGLDTATTGENVTLQADLSVLKTNSGTFSPSGTAAGGTYTIAVSNVGRAVQTLTYAANQATPATVSALLGAPYTVTDTLPTGLTLASAPIVTGTEAANWACTGVAGDASFTCTRSAGAGNIAAGNVTPVAMVSISAPVRVSLASCPGPLSNTAVLSNATIGEVLTSDNTSTVSTTLNCGASMVIAKTDNKATTTSGSANNYVITLTNNGPSAGDGSVITDTVGTGLTCPASNVVTCAVLAGGAVCPAGPLTIANLTGAGITVPTLPVTGSLQFSYTCTSN
jgi:Domain of unknown function DUF11